MAATLNATAYAVIDVTGKVKLRPEYDMGSRYHAYWLARTRNGVKDPLHPGSKWKAIKVQIKAVK